MFFSIILKLFDIFFPKVCGICEITCQEELCKTCERKLQKIKRNKKRIYLVRNYDTHMYMFDYYDLIRERILQYKFKEHVYIFRTFVKIVLKDKKVCGFLKNYDIMIPVPISKKRKQKRGYNQSQLIAKQIAQRIEKIQYYDNVLYKIKETIPQSKLDKKRRAENLVDAYIVKNSELIQSKKVLLFDDIYTTGSTVNECSKVLIQAGAKEIGVFTLAKD